MHNQTRRLRPCIWLHDAYGLLDRYVEGKRKYEGTYQKLLTIIPTITTS